MEDTKTFVVLQGTQNHSLCTKLVLKEEFASGSPPEDYFVNGSDIKVVGEVAVSGDDHVMMMLADFYTEE